MAVGRYTSDLDVGDELGPVEYTMSAFMVREYCHANELHHEYFQGSRDQIAPPTLVHLDKLRLYRHACPLGTGPDARVHVEYDGAFHEAVKTGERLSVGGVVTKRYTKRGRVYVEIEMAMRAAADGRLLVEYRDTVVIAYRGQDGAAPAGGKA